MILIRRIAVPAALMALFLGAAATPLPANASKGKVTFYGKGFDSCQGVTAAQAQTVYQSTQDETLGYYLGGKSATNSSCRLQNASWVTSVTNTGWTVLPIYSDLQSPCQPYPAGTTFPDSTTLATLAGIQTGNNAIAAAQADGLPVGAVIYLDLEGYTNGLKPARLTTCEQEAAGYVNGFDSALAQLNWVPGVYGSSSGSNLHDLTSILNKPQYIYFAEADNKNNTSSAVLPASDWNNHHRIKQYTAGAKRNLGGGVSVVADLDCADGAGDGSGFSSPCS